MSRYWMSLALGCCLAITGCDSSGEFNDYGDAPLSDNTETGHSHGAAHGGEVIEFDAAHAHHAEMVFDAQSRDITLYFYGAEIGAAHPVDALVVELEDGDEEVHLEATASPLDGETKEASSRFVVAGSEIPEGAKSLHDLEGHFHVTMDGQEFHGNFGHHHGEDGHDHGDHEDHGEHDEHGEHEDHDEDGDDHGEEGHDEDGEEDHGDDEADSDEADSDEAAEGDAEESANSAEESDSEDTAAEEADIEEEATDEDAPEEEAAE